MALGGGAGGGGGRRGRRGRKGPLTEINVTSPTGAQQLNRFSGVNAATVLWERIEDIRRIGG